MSSKFAKWPRPRAWSISLTLCGLLSVNFAHASDDDAVKPGFRGRLVSVPRKVGDGVGALISPAKSRIATVGSSLQGGVTAGFGLARASITGAGASIAAGADASYRAVKDRGAYCVKLLTTTGAVIPETLTHSSGAWALGPDLESQLQNAWTNAPNLEAALRDHVRLIFEARVNNASSKINFATVAEAEAFQKTIGRFWSPQTVDYSDFLHDTIDPRLYPECIHAVEVFKLARALGQDFNERFDVIRANLSSVVSFDSWVPLPGHIGVRVARLVAGPILDHRNENALIGASWEIARLMPVEVREKLVASIEHYIKNQVVPESERARFRRFVYAGEFERVASLVDTLQRAGVIAFASLGAEQLIVRSNEIDGSESLQVRDELRRKLKPEHEDHVRLVEVIGADGLRTLTRVFAHDDYRELDNGSEPTANPEVRDGQLEKIITRYQWARIKADEREGIERALVSLKNAHLEKSAFIKTLSDVHDNEFRRVVLKSVLPDFLTKRAPREYPR